MPTDNNSGGLMWQDENGNWHPLGEIRDVNMATFSSHETDGSSILYATSLSDSEEITIRGVCHISDEADAMFWAQAEGLDIVKRGDI